MSFDLYLLPLQPEDDFETAMSLLEALDRKDPAYAYELDARNAAQTILQLDPRYRPFQKNFAEIAKFEKITEDEARRRHVQLNSTGAPMTASHWRSFISIPTTS